MHEQASRADADAIFAAALPREQAALGLGRRPALRRGLDGLHPFLHNLLCASSDPLTVSPPVLLLAARPPSPFLPPRPFLLTPPSLFAQQTLQNNLYWLIASTARAPHELIRLSSFLRGAESAGSACGYALTASKNLPLTVPLGIDFGLWGIAITTAWMTVKEVGVSLGVKEAEEEEEQ